MYRINHLCLRVCLIDVGCQTIRHIDTDIDRNQSIEKTNPSRDNDRDNYRDKKCKTVPVGYRRDKQIDV